MPPRETWAAEFRELGAALRAALGPLALRIDHIGSTSVPGLASKDVIDIQVTVATLDLGALLGPMAAAGFAPRFDVIVYDHPPATPEVRDAEDYDGDAEWAKLYFGPAGDGPVRRRVHLHVRAAGRSRGLRRAQAALGRPQAR